MMNQDDALRKAKNIVAAGNNITYSSGASTRYIREVMRELIAVIEGDEPKPDREVCDLCLGEGRCPTCHGLGTLLSVKEAAHG
jgi:hypothetical protein